MDESNERKLIAGVEKTFILAGNATFTLRSTKSGTRFTYKVSKAPCFAHGEKCESCPVAYFIGLLSGPDNNSNYTYLGIIRDSKVSRTKNSKVGDSAPSYLAIKWYVDRLLASQDVSAVEIFHAGACCRCGRKLTVPESIMLGIGPECLSKMGGI